MTDEILVVLASRRDAAVGEAGRGQKPIRRALMTPEDLSQPGWNFRLHDPAGSIAMLAESPLSASAIAGVVTRLPGVTEHDLTHIAQSDRTYLAAEMTLKE